MPATRKRKLESHDAEKPITAPSTRSKANGKTAAPAPEANGGETRPKRQRKAPATTIVEEPEKTRSVKKKTEPATPTKAKKKATAAATPQEKKTAKTPTKTSAASKAKSTKASAAAPATPKSKTTTAAKKTRTPTAAKPATKKKAEPAAKPKATRATPASKKEKPVEVKEKPAKKVAAPPKPKPAPRVPRDRAALAAAAVLKAQKARSGKQSFNPIPELPQQRLNVYVFGSGSICELGLGPTVTEVKRPRLNPLLPIDSVGIVKVAVGGAHVIALDHIGRVWSWGQNDSGALGRVTKESDDDVEDDWIINSKESSPGLVEGFPETAIFVDIVATDNISAAVTDEGHLWAWGTFIDDGKKSFKTGVEYQREPVHINTVRNVAKLSAGKDHILILDKNGDVYSWGVGTSFQLGVSVNSNLRSHVFGPLKVPGLKKIKGVFAGEYHSLAIDQDGKVYSWGLNNFGQAGNPDEAGDGAVIQKPTHAEFFDDKNIVQIACGNHHSLALTADGDIYAFGEMNFHQLGLDPSNLPESTVREKDGTPAYVPIPTKIEGPNVPKFKYVAAGTDHSLAISTDGAPYTWGFGETYQLGHGKPAGEDSPEDEEVPTKIDNTATRGVQIVFAGAGGQFSVLAGLPREEEVAKVEEKKETKDVEMAETATEAKEEVKEDVKDEPKEESKEDTKADVDMPDAE